MNQITIMGRLTNDIEIKTTGSGIEYADFSVAVDRKKGKDGEKKSDFFRCTAWRKTAVFVQTYFKKGDGIIISGSMLNDPYEDKDGKKRDSWKLHIANVDFPIGKKGSNSDVFDRIESAATESGFTAISENDPNLPFSF